MPPKPRPTKSPAGVKKTTTTKSSVPAAKPSSRKKPEPAAPVSSNVRSKAAGNAKDQNPDKTKPEIPATKAALASQPESPNRETEVKQLLDTVADEVVSIASPIRPKKTEISSPEKWAGVEFTWVGI